MRLLALTVAAQAAQAALPTLGRRWRTTLLPRQFEACDVYCHGELLEAVQLAAVFDDSKTFVDRPLRVSPTQALEAFDALPAADRSNPEALKVFVDAHFDAEGTDLVEWTPDDYSPTPALVDRIDNTTLKAFALELNALWLDLGRRVHPRVFEFPDRTSLLPLPHPFVVPGGRFREVYYWDTLWVLRGLFACGMLETARGMVDNLVYMVDRYGFVPNGARIYYSNRSQPPVLAEMVALMFEADPDVEWLRSKALPALDREYNFFMDTRFGHYVPEVGLNRYFVNATAPRPESFLEDAELAALLPPDDQTRFLSDVAAAAESGWDFSSRWFAVPAEDSLLATRTRERIPVDLNVLLLRSEQRLAQLHDLVGASDRAAVYQAAAASRTERIREFLWTGTVWSDYDLASRAPVPTDSLYASNFLPLWVGGALLDHVDVGAVVALLEESLVHPGGIATSTVESGEQWDFPNAWPPLQFFLIDALQTIDPARAQALAEAWIRANIIALEETGYMHEKLDATVPGQIGGGGEYRPQVGFGWSNGVVLWILEEFYASKA